MMNQVIHHHAANARDARRENFLAAGEPLPSLIISASLALAAPAGFRDVFVKLASSSFRLRSGQLEGRTVHRRVIEFSVLRVMGSQPPMVATWIASQPTVPDLSCGFQSHFFVGTASSALRVSAFLVDSGSIDCPMVITSLPCEV